MLTGPSGPIPYQRDAWGYPDIEVRDAVEAAWARGWFHGHDRQGQVRLALMAAQGRMLEVLGDVPLGRAIDRATRALGMAHGLDAQVQQLDAEALRWMDAYCAGFDAGAAAGGRPWIMRLLGIPQTPYRREDILLTYRILCWFGLTSLTQSGRMAIAQLQCGGIEEDELAFLLGPRGIAGLDASAADGMTWPEQLAMATLGLTGGSNAFAVAPSRSASGSALLMAEFHMEIGRQPPVMYAASTRSPDGWLYQGVGLPGWPFVSAGRSRDLGWAYTFGHADHITLTAERCRGGERETEQGWRPLTRREDAVSIRGVRGAETWTFWQDGPLTVVGDASGDAVLPGICWLGLDRSGEDLNRFVHQVGHTTAEGFMEAHAGHRALSTVVVAADRAGHIAWSHSGYVQEGPPAGWGVQPGGRAAFAGAMENPRVLDPDEGFLVSANEACGRFTVFAEPPYRHQRIRDRLGARADWTPEALLTVSYDAHDLCAARLLAVWAGLLPDDPRAREMVAWASSQGTELASQDRVHAARFHALHSEVTHALVARRLDAHRAEFVMEGMNIHLQIQPHLDDVLALEHPRWLDEEALGLLLAEAWPAALDRVARGDAAGPVDARFKNVLTRGLLPAWVGVSTAPLPLPGTPTSPFQVRQIDVFGDRLVTGPAFHVVMDMGSDLAEYNIAGGASERWRGVGYGTAIEDWLAAVVRPLPGNEPGA